MATYIKTSHPEFDELIPRIRGFLEKDVLEVTIDGKRIRGYRSPDAKSIWIRDYSDMMRGLKYFESDLKNVVDHFAETQADNGRIFDYFTTFPEKLPGERENWTKYVRVPVEADVEYRFVKAAFLAWQATGDDDWVLFLLPKMEKALHYSLTHPWRWDDQHGLVKRAYTIDTWDFAYTAGKHPWLQFQINDDTFWGIMHGDNSGYYEAMLLMERLCAYFKDSEKAEIWSRKAEALKSNLNRVCWNGKFYSHFVKLTPLTIPGVDEAAQLSLSNPMNINRGTTTREMAASILQEYIERRKKSYAFAEWFSIDPPFPDGIFSDEKLKRGTYVNGGIMPLVGGELAKAAFDNGFEEYGVDILKRYYRLISENNETYLWYTPQGVPATLETSTSPEAEPTDGWGSSAMLYALIEGLAGVEDESKQLRDVRLSPRWAAAGIDKAEVQIEYPASQATFWYKYQQDDQAITLIVNSLEAEIHFHVLITKEKKVKKVMSGNKSIAFLRKNIRNSQYIDFFETVKGETMIKIQLKK